MVENDSMARKPAGPADIGAAVTFWPIDNRTEEGVLEKIEKGVHFIRTPSGALVEALAHQVHRGHAG